MHRRRGRNPDANKLIIFHNPTGSATFDPRITTLVSTIVIWETEVGRTITAGTTHDLSYTPTAGAKICKVTVQGGLGLVTGIACDSDAVTLTKNIQKLINCTSYIFTTNSDLSLQLSQLIRKYTLLKAAGLANLSGSLSDIPATAQTVWINGYAITPASINALTALSDIKAQDEGWLTAETDLVLKSISDAIHANVNTFSAASITANFGGANQAPSHLDGWIDPLITPGTGASDDHWEWDAGAGKHKAISGGAAIWAANHCAGHPWTITYNGGISEDSLLGNVIGTGEKTWAADSSANTLLMSKFTANAGTIGDIRAKIGFSGNAKVAIYSDNAGVPGTLLAYSPGAAVYARWNTFQLNVQVALTATSYWLAVIGDAASGVCRYIGSGGVCKAIGAYGYVNAFPNPPVGTSNSNADVAIAGWGLKVV
jgi:hypothetical protein